MIICNHDNPEGLRQESIARETDSHLANPIIPDDILSGKSSNAEGKIFGKYFCELVCVL